MFDRHHSEHGERPHGAGHFRGYRTGPRGGRFGGDEGGMDWDHGGPGGGRGGHGGGRRRIFDGGELRLVLLKLIADKPRHGYDLIRAIEERTGGAYAPSPGIVYPTLTLLGEMGLTDEQATEGARKAFAITAEGEAHLRERADEVAAIFARLDAMSAMRERTDAIPLRRAMHNLRSVLLNRLTVGLDEARIHAAVELIDETARKIERL
jgi:DNA-binding PadR family transcriptional regulator